MHPFDIDKQTLRDLEIFGSNTNQKTLFNLFNKTCTLEGESTLKLILNSPLTEPDLISERSKLIAYLQESGAHFTLDKESLDFIEFYLRQNNKPKSPTAFVKTSSLLSAYFKPTRELYLKQRGAQEVLDLIIYLNNLFQSLMAKEEFSFLKKLNDVLLEICSNPNLRTHLSDGNLKLNSFKLSIVDFQIREKELNKIKRLLYFVYELDAYFAVAKTAKKHTLSYPILNNQAEKSIEINGLWHLFIAEPVVNDIYISSDKNVSFLTGVNMAGKSTLLKSVAICLYLAHLGFPVPAKEMRTSIFQGLVTTINISDNLSEGHSHFYNEVLRLKAVSEKINESKSLLIIFDELFRGTNVQDAHEASVSIINAFSKIKNCLFLVSTHIVEVAEDLRTNQNIDFNFLETEMINGKPSFSHQLKPGITADRMGLWIIENEGIMEVLNKNANRKTLE